MALEDLRGKLPPYAADIAANLATLADETVLNSQQKWGVFLASAYAIGQPDVVRAVDEAADLSESARKAAKAAAAIEGMNNIYYRAVNTLASAEYKTLPPRLRMQALAEPGAPPLDWELWSLAVSAINGCALCMDSHETELRKHSLGGEHVQTALRIAAVVHAASRILAAEAAAADGRDQDSSPAG